MAMPLTDTEPSERPSLHGLLRKAYASWATRSLAIGAMATGLDILVGLICLHALLLPTRAGAMMGVAVGGAFTFFANRYFAFKEHNPKLAKPALKFVLATGLGMIVHGQLVVLMRDQAGIPFVIAKIIADLGVFSIGQLFVFRYLVFPAAKQPQPGAGSEALVAEPGSLNAMPSLPVVEERPAAGGSS